MAFADVHVITCGYVSKGPETTKYCHDALSTLLQAQAQFEAAVKQFNVEQKEVEGLLQKRDDAYLDMLAINEDRTSMTAASTHGDFPLKGMAVTGGLVESM